MNEGINFKHLITSNGVNVSLPKVLMIMAFIMCIVVTFINPTSLPSWIGILGIPTLSNTSKGIAYHNRKKNENIETIKKGN